MKVITDDDGGRGRRETTGKVLCASQIRLNMVGTTDDRREGNSEPKCPTNFDDGARIWEATGCDRRRTIYIAHILGTSWLCRQN